MSERIQAALKIAGLDAEWVAPDDLAPLDEFHTLGRVATIELAELAVVSPGQRILDIGAGLGGPARFLAHRYGCRVTALDLTAEYCFLNALMTQRCGLQHLVEIRQGNALDLPFGDGSFEVVWTQHASMNIADKARFYGEAHRVLGPGGRLAFFDVAAGANQPVHFPVPWADDASISFLESPEELKALLRAAGFRTLVWNDLTARVAKWYREQDKAPAGEVPVLDKTILAEDMPLKFANVARNVEEGRIRMLQAVVEKS